MGNIDLSKAKLPPIYKRNRKDCYLDPIREKLIYITPEETVRQQVISYLLDELKVPIGAIRIEEHLSHYGIRSIKVMFVIITDGEENSSREYSADKVHSMIEHEKEKYGWEFIFLGANIDAVQTVQRFSIDADRAVDYIPDAKGTQLNFEAMAETVACYRMTGAVPAEPMEEIRKDMKKRGGRK